MRSDNFTSEKKRLEQHRSLTTASKEMSPMAPFFCLRIVDRIRVRVKNSPHYYYYYLLFSIHAKRYRRIL